MTAMGSGTLWKTTCGMLGTALSSRQVERSIAWPRQDYKQIPGSYLAPLGTPALDSCVLSCKEFLQRAQRLPPPKLVALL